MKKNEQQQSTVEVGHDERILARASGSYQSPVVVPDI